MISTYLKPTQSCLRFPLVPLLTLPRHWQQPHHFPFFLLLVFLLLLVRHPFLRGRPWGPFGGLTKILLKRHLHSRDQNHRNPKINGVKRRIYSTLISENYYTAYPSFILDEYLYPAIFFSIENLWWKNMALTILFLRIRSHKIGFVFMSWGCDINCSIRYPQTIQYHKNSLLVGNDLK